MALPTYPLSIPSSPSNFRTSDWRIVRSVAVNVSPFTMAQQSGDFGGSVWQTTVTLPPMKRDDAEQRNSFFLKLYGQFGTFLLGDPNASVPRGTASSSAGTPVVNGASQTGDTLNIDGVPVNQTGYLKAGDYISLGTGTSTRLYKVLDDANSNGSGEVTVEIFPDLRTSPADDATLTVASAKGTWRLTSNQTDWSIDTISLYGLTFACEEAL